MNTGVFFSVFYLNFLVSDYAPSQFYTRKKRLFFLSAAYCIHFEQIKILNRQIKKKETKGHGRCISDGQEAPLGTRSQGRPMPQKTPVGRLVHARQKMEHYEAVERRCAVGSFCHRLIMYCVVCVCV